MEFLHHFRIDFINVKIQPHSFNRSSRLYSLAALHTIQTITSKVYTHIAKSLLCPPDSENSIVVVQKNDLANLPNARYSFVLR
jgi:hypothetical protein